MQINEVEVNTNIFTIEAIKPYLYEQYKNIEGLEGLVEALANYIQDNYFSKIQEMWSCRDIARSLSPYLTFYSRYYLGIIRPIQVDSGDMDTEIDTDTVQIGNTVKVLDIEFNEKIEYTIVGSTEVNLAENKISNESPLGSALLGAKKNQTVDVNAPAGIMKYKILDITK